MPKLPQVVFVVPPGVQVLDLTGPVQAFYEAGTYGVPYALTYCSYRLPEVSAAAGLGLHGLRLLSEVAVEADDLVFLPGLELEYVRSAAFRNEAGPLLAWLRGLHAQGTLLCSVCTGAFLLGEAGLLDGRKCTTHWRRLDELRARYPRAVIQPNRLFVRDGNVYTSAGVTAGIDLTLHLLEQRHGALFATRVARELVVYARRGAGHEQRSVYLDYRNHLSQAVHRVQDWLIANLARRVSLAELAEIAHMSPRNLTRTFRKEAGLTVGDYTARLRRELAQTLSRNPDLTADAVAAACGLRSARQLRRIWNRPARGSASPADS